MPTYIYKNQKTGEIREMVFSIAQKEQLEDPVTKDLNLKDGQWIRNWEQEFSESQIVYQGGWPMESVAMGVHPLQRQEAIEHSHKIKIPTEFTEDGNPMFTSRKHRKDYCEALGFIDRNGGYGDPQPTKGAKLRE